METPQESQFAQHEVLPEEKLESASSFSTRLTNVFAGPDELFTELIVQPVKTTSWLIPLICSILLACGFTWVLFSNPTLRDQMMESQRQEMQKKVASGDMTQEQADKASEMMSGDSIIIKAFGAAAASAVAAIAFFVLPLILFGAAKFALHYDGKYFKVLELYGLLSLIGFVGGVVAMIMILGLNTLYASPSAALAVLGNYDRHNTLHNLLASLNVFTLWETAIIGMGLAKFSKRPAMHGMGLVFALWAIWAVFSSLMGWGMK